MTALLEARLVTKAFGGGLFAGPPNVALKDFTMAIAVEPPSITAVVGESGSGKTTLARLLLGLTPPTYGNVLYEGHDLQRMSREERKRFRREVQVIFQDPYEVYNPFYKVDHVLTTPVEKFKLAPTKQAQKDMIVAGLQAVGLRPEETLGRYPHQLSGGQRQRVMVARALMLKPRIILADEPVSMVDASLRATILGSLQKMNWELGISIIYITHDLTTAYQISDNMIVLYRGSVVEAGDVELVVRQPKHPYTRLLISSIPLPSTDRRWVAEGSPAQVGQPGEGACAFASRCPSSVPACMAMAPSLYRTDEFRAVACALYQDEPELDRENMGDIFVSGRRPISTAESPIMG
jgi:oligopeptide/dipeptide ABC transporter ATP-binding protein